MKIARIDLKNYKRFTNLSIQGLPRTAKLVLIVGPNGSGKTSLFDAFNLWYRIKGQLSWATDNLFHSKDSSLPSDWNSFVNIEFHDNNNAYGEHQRGKFYFRSAYRNQADFTINNLQKQHDPTTKPKLDLLIQNDETVSENYQRLISLTLAGVYNAANDGKTVEKFREELIGKIKTSLNNVFEDLTLSSIGDPLSSGSFYFEKGLSKNFHYKNLSGGEKSAFDIILDLIIKLTYYPEAIFCIDEPEAHMHTKLQSLLLEEIYRLIPDNSQLWLNTHSIGMLKKAKEIERYHPGSVVFINFDNRDFDTTTIIEPSVIDKTIWNKFVEIALGDFSDLVAPAQIVFCEGTSKGRKYKNFDSQIYSRIFGSKYHETSFVSIGSASELEKSENPSYQIVGELLKNTDIIKIVDRDDKSPSEVHEVEQKGIKVLKRRHIESYLFDDEILTKLCNSMGKQDKTTEILDSKKRLLTESVARGNATDDIKSAAGPIYVEIKKALTMTGCGNTYEAFLRDTITPLITEDTTIFRELEVEIFK